MKFLIQFQTAPTSRQMVHTDRIKNQLAMFGENIAQVAFEGPVPSVSVILEESPEATSEGGAQ